MHAEPFRSSRARRHRTHPRRARRGGVGALGSTSRVAMDFGAMLEGFRFGAPGSPSPLKRAKVAPTEEARVAKTNDQDEDSWHVSESVEADDADADDADAVTSAGAANGEQRGRLGETNETDASGRDGRDALAPGTSSPMDLVDADDDASPALFPVTSLPIDPADAVVRRLEKRFVAVRLGGGGANLREVNAPADERARTTEILLARVNAPADERALITKLAWTRMASAFAGAADVAESSTLFVEPATNASNAIRSASAPFCRHTRRMYALRPRANAAPAANTPTVVFIRSFSLSAVNTRSVNSEPSQGSSSASSSSFDARAGRSAGTTRERTWTL